MDKAAANDFTKSIRTSRLRFEIKRSITQALKSDVIGLHYKIRASRSELETLQRDINRLSFIKWATACSDLPDLDALRGHARKHRFLVNLNEELAILAEQDHQERAERKESEKKLDAAARDLAYEKKLLEACQYELQEYQKQFQKKSAAMANDLVQSSRLTEVLKKKLKDSQCKNAKVAQELRILSSKKLQLDKSVVNICARNICSTAIATSVRSVTATIHRHQLLEPSAAQTEAACLMMDLRLRSAQPA